MRGATRPLPSPPGAPLWCTPKLPPSAHLRSLTPGSNSAASSPQPTFLSPLLPFSLSHLTTIPLSCPPLAPSPCLAPPTPIAPYTLTASSPRCCLLSVFSVFFSNLVLLPSLFRFSSFLTLPHTAALAFAADTSAGAVPSLAPLLTFPVSPPFPLTRLSHPLCSFVYSQYGCCLHPHHRSLHIHLNPFTIIRHNVSTRNKNIQH